MSKNLNAPQKWWDKLQMLLDREGCDLNLNEPADLARLIIYNENQNGSPYISFAMDTSDSGIIDLRHEDDEFEYNGDDFLRSQPKGPIEPYDINRLYMAAKEGRLFVAPLAGSAAGNDYRMLRADENESPFLAPDLSHLSEADANDMFLLSPPVVPQKPAFPGIITYILALFGNQEAKNKLAAYNAMTVEYRADKKAYDEYPQQAGRIAENKPWLKKFHDFCNLMNDGDHRIGRLKLQTKLEELHSQSLVKDYPENQHKFQMARIFQTKMIQQIGGKLAEVKGGSLRPKEKLGDFELRLLAEALLRRHEIQRGEKLLKDGKIEDFEPKKIEAPDITKMVNSTRFCDLFGNMLGADLLPFAEYGLDPKIAFSILDNIVNTKTAQYNARMAEESGRNKIEDTTAIRSTESIHKSSPEKDQILLYAGF